MRFAHIADCHIGAWREPLLRNANLQAFSRAVEICIERQVDFILISGDLFNTSFPSIDSLKEAVYGLSQLKAAGIPVYVIPGSHDFSPSGKTMLDVLENANLFTNVFRGRVEDSKLRLKFTIDKKTGAKITGILGKRGMLESSYYESLDRELLEAEDGFKIFMFHSPVQELLPGEQWFETSPLSFFPKRFSYYAGGHVHIVHSAEIKGYGLFAYPGPLFPNSFSELEELQHGGFYIVEYSGGELSQEYQPIILYNVLPIKIVCDGKSPQEVHSEIVEKTAGKELINTIVLIRLSGRLASGKTSDIPFNEIYEELYSRGAFTVLKNTSLLSTEEFESISSSSGSVREIEERMLTENAPSMTVEKIGADKTKQFLSTLMEILSAERKEGERVQDFEVRLKEDFKKILTEYAGGDP
ncbi:MAG: DNA repair exonuclease [Candidatus Woesearchaeota archaeon]